MSQHLESDWINSTARVIVRELVRTPSRNPEDTEQAIAKLIAGYLRDTACEIDVVEFAPGRPSLAATLRGASDGPTLVLNGHIDTVPIDEPNRWSADPFGAEVRDGWLYGRGAADMKAGIAAQLTAVIALARRTQGLAGHLVAHFAAGEERTEPGTISLLEAGHTGEYGIVTEPTRLELAVAMRGMATYAVEISGASSHAGEADKGRNPILAVPALLEAVGRYDARLRSTVTHPLLGPTTCSPTVIRAGIEPAAIPDTCVVLLDRRIIPGERVADVGDELRRLVDAVAQRWDELGWDLQERQAFPPCEVSQDSEFVRVSIDAITRTRGEAPAITGTSFGSDVTWLVEQAGMEAIQFGPGDIQYAHAPNERVALVEVETASRALVEIASAMLS